MNRILTFAFVMTFVLGAGKLQARQVATASAETDERVVVEFKDGVAELTPENTKVDFVGTHSKGEPNPRHGGFKTFKGKLALTENGESVKELTFDFETDSVWTEIGDRLTDHLKNADFLDVQKFPAATFKSTNVKPGTTAGTFDVVGDFTLLGKTNEITIPVKMTKDGEAILVTGKFSFDRVTFGMGKLLDDVAKDISIIVSIGEKTTGKAPAVSKPDAEG